MGVHTLWKLLLPIGRRISIETLQYESLAIDVSIWIIQFMKITMNNTNNSSSIKNGDNSYEPSSSSSATQSMTIIQQILIGFVRRICRLLYHHIRPIFVFDGIAPEIKRREIQKRNKIRRDETLLLTASDEYVHRMARKLLHDRIRIQQQQQLIKVQPTESTTPTATTSATSSTSTNGAFVSGFNPGGKRQALVTTTDPIEGGSCIDDPTTVVESISNAISTTATTTAIQTDDTKEIEIVDIEDDNNNDDDDVQYIATSNNKSTISDWDAVVIHKDSDGNEDDDNDIDNDDNPINVVDDDDDNSVEYEDFIEPKAQHHQQPQRNGSYKNAKKNSALPTIEDLIMINDMNGSNNTKTNNTNVKDVIESIQRQHRITSRQQYIPVSNDMQQFSTVQMNNFLQSCQLNRQIRTTMLQKASVVQSQQDETGKTSTSLHISKEEHHHQQQQQSKIRTRTMSQYMASDNTIRVELIQEEIPDHTCRNRNTNSISVSSNWKNDIYYHNNYNHSDGRKRNPNNNTKKVDPVTKTFQLLLSSNHTMNETTSDININIGHENDNDTKNHLQTNRRLNSIQTNDQQNYDTQSTLIRHSIGNNNNNNSDVIKLVVDTDDESNNSLTLEHHRSIGDDEDIQRALWNDAIASKSSSTKDEDIDKTKYKSESLSDDENVNHTIVPQHRRHHGRRIVLDDDDNSDDGNDDDDEATENDRKTVNVCQVSETNTNVSNVVNLKKEGIPGSALRTDHLCDHDVNIRSVENLFSVVSEGSGQGGFISPSTEIEIKDNKNTPSNDTTIVRHDNDDASDNNGHVNAGDDDDIEWEDGDDNYISHEDVASEDTGSYVDNEKADPESILINGGTRTKNNNNSSDQPSQDELDVPSYTRTLPRIDGNNYFTDDFNSVPPPINTFESSVNGTLEQRNETNPASDVLLRGQETASKLASWAGHVYRRAMKEANVGNSTTDVVDSANDDDDDNDYDEDDYIAFVTDSQSNGLINHNTHNSNSAVIESNGRRNASAKSQTSESTRNNNISWNDITVDSELLEQNDAQWTAERNRRERDAENISDEILVEVKQLLQFFGIPYLEAPSEAEAQCVALEQLGLVKGIVTEDSDAFAFGGKMIYKNIFEEQKYTEVYNASDADREMNLNHNSMIALALLLGSDYTEGVKGVGIVNAMEILDTFDVRTDLKGGLLSFRKWLDGFDPPTPLSDLSDDVDDNTRKVAKFHAKHMSARTRWIVPQQFPADTVIKAYLDPVVDKSNEPFTWGEPDYEKIITFCNKHIGWTPGDTKRYLEPVIQVRNERKGLRQTRIDAYMKYEDSIKFADVRSKRLRQVLGYKNDDNDSNQKSALKRSRSSKKT